VEKTAALALQRELEVVGDRMELEPVGFWNFRPIPSSAISGLVVAGEVDLPSKNTSPASGRVLPVMTSIIVVLPAPFGPMMARISPFSTASEARSAPEPRRRRR